MKFVSVILLVSILQYSHSAYSWGGRGHNSICEAAVNLVKTNELKEFLKARPHIMGHLCNIPDIYWKSLPSEVKAPDYAAHFINAEKIGLKLADIPLDYKKIMEAYTGKPNKENEAQTLFSIPDELGSLWWRGDHFYRLSEAAAKRAKESTPPKDFKEEQDSELAYNKAVYDMITSMGLLGHYIGDNAQPLHNTSDYDGYAANQGGLHSYYETDVVGQMSGDLIGRIVKQAISFKAQKFTSYNSIIENMQSLSVISNGEVKEVLKADKVLKPSSLTVEKGMSLKKPAERRPAADSVKSFDKLIVRQMARASLLLAHCWEQAYKAAGEPSLKYYRSYRYPFTPDMIKPDYL